MKKVLLFTVSIFFSCLHSQNNFDIDATLKTERRDQIITKIDIYLNKKCNYGQNIGKLNDSQRVLLIIENLEREVNNGGFHQFYINSSGNYANETIDALTRIGALKTAEIVRTANSEFKNGLVPTDRGKRFSEVQNIAQKAEKNWSKCNLDFYEYEDNLTELLISFVIQHKNDFRE